MSAPGLCCGACPSYPVAVVGFPLVLVLYLFVVSVLFIYLFIYLFIFYHCMSFYCLVLLLVCFTDI